MRKFMLSAAAVAATFAALPAIAQDQASAPAPDTDRANRIEPYFGVMGGWEGFDNQPNKAGIPPVASSDKLNGGLVQAVAGVNVPVGPVFVGAEGNVAKGFSGDINWEYGAAGRIGVRAGHSGLIYGKVGYQWVNFDKRVDTDRHYNDWTYGIGFEVGPRDLGAQSDGGIRLRGEVSTFGNFHSFRPMMGLVKAF
ncbi:MULTISPECIES: opacity protein [Sphingomonas]|uniref:Opacity protein n=1 Tax=Sphingomonas lycopersici TaxID=2951807 RepID=A0AA41ZCD8_9SPHN|nr:MULTISPECIES: opacity protein [Sphingomonas]MCW6531797.1 opacity protein [Sphingomonas lycopersici]MCW6537445.1 opacity protein [Sphingomonas lycopersici]OJU16775.1 MAG: opacity protein [Sphingomonas sp. 66-10]